MKATVLLSTVLIIFILFFKLPSHILLEDIRISSDVQLRFQTKICFLSGTLFPCLFSSLFFPLIFHLFLFPMYRINYQCVLETS